VLSRGSGRKSAPPTGACEICVLAGGLGSRLGRDKARLRLGGRTCLAHLRAVARALELPLRVIRRDLVDRCGPLGGVYTALETTGSDLVLFLACDMPFVPPSLLGRLRQRLSPRTEALFVRRADGVEFPFLLRQSAVGRVRELIAARRFSLQALAEVTRARTLVPTAAERKWLININTTADLAAAAELARR